MTDSDDTNHLRSMVDFLGAGTEDDRGMWNDRALVTIRMLRDTFPKLDDETLAGFCGAITYLVGELSFAKVADAGRMCNVLYMSYSLAAAHLLGVYDAGDSSATPPPVPEPARPEQTGQYL